MFKFLSACFLCLLVFSKIPAQSIKLNEENIKNELIDKNIKDLTLKHFGCLDFQYVSLSALSSLSQLQSLKIDIETSFICHLGKNHNRLALFPLLESLPLLPSLQSFTLNAPFSNVCFPFVDENGINSFTAQQELINYFFEKLSQMQNLRELHLSNSNIFGAVTLESISLLSQLETLSLYLSFHDRRDLSWLVSLKNLRHLSLINNLIDAHSFKNISRDLKKLESLRFSSTYPIFFDELMSSLSEIKSLKSVELVGRLEVSNADERLLLDNLEVFNLNHSTNLSASLFSMLFLPHLKELQINGCNRGEGLSSWDFSSLAPQLRSLAISDYKTYPNISSLAANTSLQELQIKNAHFSKDELEQLNWVSLPSLRVVDLSGATLSKLNYTYFSPNLEKLFLINAHIKPSDIKNISNLQHLHTLSLSGTDISKTALKHFQNLSSLRRLDLSHTPLRDANFELLSNLSLLEELNVSSTSLTVADLEKLALLKQLKILDVRNLKNTNITEAHLNKLAAELPNCQILSN